MIAGIAVAVAAWLAVGNIRARRRRRARATPVYAIVRARIGSTDAGTEAPALHLKLVRPPADRTGVWSRLDEAVDPVRFRPKLADDVEVKVFRLRWGNDYAMVANPRDLLHFELEVREAELLELMEGTRTVGDIVVERLQDAGDLDAGSVADLVQTLHTSRFLDPQPVDVDHAVAEAIDPASPGRRRAQRFVKTLMLEWTGADRFVRACYRLALRWFFNPIPALLSSLFAVGGLIAFIAVERSGRFSLHDASAPADTAILLALAFVLTFAHELGHAVVLTHYGRRIKSAGFMIYFGSPAFFVDASDGLMMERRQRMLQSVAGPFAELVLAGIASVALLAFPDAGVAPILYKFALLNYFVIFLNLVPLLELDGYYLLSDLIQVPDLRPRSLEFVQHDLWHKLRLRERFTPQEIGLGLYGVVGVLFTIFSLYTAYFFWEEIFGGLIGALWRGGLWSQLLLLALALFLGGPAIRGFVNFVRAIARAGRSILRRIRFRLETTWRVEAAEMIDALPAFGELDEDTLSDLAGRVRLRAYRPGQPVFRQGERATAFYVIRRGTVRVEEENPDTGDVQVLRTLTRGGSFGELGLLQGSPRTATVRADDDVELFEVDKGTFDRLLAGAAETPEFALTLQAMAELRELPAFSILGTEDLAELLKHGRWVTAVPGEALVIQGEVGDAFYAIRSGQADVERDGEKIRTIGPGDYFGEIALLQDVPRTASVAARTPIRAFRLDREGFDRVIRVSFARGALKPATGRTWQH